MPGVGGRGKGGVGGSHGGLHGAKRLAETGSCTDDMVRASGGPPEMDRAVEKLLASMGMGSGNVLVCAEGDLSNDDRFGRRVLVVTADRLLVFSIDGDGGACDADVRIKDIRKIKTVQDVGVASLEVETGGGPCTLIRYTLRTARKFSWIAGEIQRYLEETRKELAKDGGCGGGGDGGTKVHRGGGAGHPEAGVGTAQAVPKSDAESASAETRSAAPPGGTSKAEARDGERGGARLSFIEGRERGPRPCPKCGRMLEENTRVCPVCIEKSKTFLRLLLLAKPYWRRLLLLVFLMTAGTAISMIPPYLYKVLIDEVLLPRAHPEWLILLVAGIYGMQVLGSGLGAMRECLNAELGAKIASELRGKVYRHLQNLSLSYYDRQKIGNVMDRVGRDAGNLQHFLVHHVDYLVIQAMQFAVVSAILLALNWRLALIVMVPMPFAVAAFRWVMRILIRRWRHMWDVTTRMTSFLNDSISGVRVIKAFGSEPVELRKFERRNKDLYEYSSELGRIEAVLWPMLMLLMEIVTVLIWFFGGREIIGGEMTLGTLTAYMFYVGRFVQSAQSFGFFGRMTTQSMTSAERVFEVLDERPEVEEADDAVPMPRIEGRIEFRDVTFGYEKLKPVIKKLSFKVEPGQMLGLVGSSGAGKSTTINLLARLYDVQEGQILIDGVDIRKIRQADLRSQIGVVLQETFLFSGTIGENIAYGRPDASRTDVIKASAAACAHDFIMRMPDGYDTDIGEKGGKLSGGEKQRIAIARAILHDPRILILDEATSSVDTETENQIQKGLKRLIKGRTTIAIAHRLSTLRHANKLLVLEKGEKMEMGTHDELMAKEKGAYRKLVEMQTEWSKIIAYR